MEYVAILQKFAEDLDEIKLSSSDPTRRSPLVPDQIQGFHVLHYFSLFPILTL